MNRKDKPLLHRIFTTLCAFTLIGAGMYAIFAGLNLASGIVIGLAIASIATPVVIDGGSILEVVSGVFEALIEGLMGVLDAIGSIFIFKQMNKTRTHNKKGYFALRAGTYLWRYA